MTRYKEADLSAIQTQPVGERHSKVTVDAFAGRATPEMAALLGVLPSILAGNTARDICARVALAARNKRPVLAMIGGHVIKTGCGPLLIQLMEEGVLSAVAMNGATAIHDFEVASFGRTSEDVQAALGDGSFGMARETSDLMNGITTRARQEALGLGEALGAHLVQTQAPHADVSVLAEAYRLGIPVTVHVALGTDILHQHASAEGKAIGETSLRDFRILAGILEDFTGGVALNIGSAVLLPEVFLKAFSVALNLGANPRNITTVNLDFIRHYRPSQNVLNRPNAEGRGIGLELTGHHEILLPLLTAGILARLKAPVS